MKNNDPFNMSFNPVRLDDRPVYNSSPMSVYTPRSPYEAASRANSRTTDSRLGLPANSYLGPHSGPRSGSNHPAPQPCPQPFSQLQVSNITKKPDIVYQMKQTPYSVQNNDYTIDELQEELSSYMDLLQLSTYGIGSEKKEEKSKLEEKPELDRKSRFPPSNTLTNAAATKTANNVKSNAPTIPQRHPRHRYYRDMCGSDKNLTEECPPAKSIKTKHSEYDLKNPKHQNQKKNLENDGSDYHHNNGTTTNNKHREHETPVSIPHNKIVIDLPSVESPWKLWADSQLAQWGQDVDRTLGNDNLNLELSANSESDSFDLGYKLSESEDTNLTDPTKTSIVCSNDMNNDDLDNDPKNDVGKRRYRGLFSGAIMKLNVVKKRQPKPKKSSNGLEFNSMLDDEDHNYKRKNSTGLDSLGLDDYSDDTGSLFKDLHGEDLYKLIETTITDTNNLRAEDESQYLGDSLDDVHSVKTTTSVFTAVRYQVRRLRRRSSTLNLFHRSGTADQQSIASFSNEPRNGFAGGRKYRHRKLFSRSNVEL